MSNHERHLEALYQATRQMLTKAETQAETDVLFDDAGKARKADRKKMEKLFVQMPGAETMSPQLQKEAKVFGRHPDRDVARASLPKAKRRAMYAEYARDKAKEEPTGYPKAMLGGALIGGGVGALNGGLRAGVPGLAIGGGIGAATGMGLGAMAAHIDKETITKARAAIRSGGAMDRAFDKQVREMEDMQDKHASVTKNLEKFFEKTAGKTEAQLRYPELLKAAASSTMSGPSPAPSVGQPKKATATSTSGTTPVRSALSGGAS